MIFNFNLNLFLKYKIYIAVGCIVLLLFLIFIMILKNQNEIIRTLNDRAINTEKIANTFYIPSVAGQWGEVQLKRLVEISGMLPYCEFITQNEIKEGRPDMTIKMPNKCIIHVDSKAPMTAYLKSIDEPSNPKWIKENAKSIKNHISILSKREYWKSNSGPELTVMFIPSEAIWLSAVNNDSSIIEYAANYNIIITTPMTLVGLLKTIYFGWQNSAFNTDISKVLNTIKEMKNITHEVNLAIDICLQLNNKQTSKLQDITKILNKVNTAILEEKANTIVLE